MLYNNFGKQGKIRERYQNSLWFEAQFQDDAHSHAETSLAYSHTPPVSPRRHVVSNVGACAWGWTYRSPISERR